MKEKVHHTASARRRFEGKTALVTGAAQGIGREVSLALAREGAQVILVDRSKIAHEVAEEARTFGAEVSVMLADVEQYAACRRTVNRAARLTGRIDVLVNNVGGTIWVQPFEHYDEHQIVAEINRSLYPTLWCCRAVLPNMIERRQGVIVNVSSVATRGVHRVPYSAAKGGVNALTASLAMEHTRHGIRINATAPGGTEAPPRRVPRNQAAASQPTALETAWYQGVIDQTKDSSLMHRYGTIDEQVAPILFLASDEASYITGSVLAVAGGDQG